MTIYADAKIQKKPRYHIGAIFFCLNVLVFSINVACNSENLYYREQRYAKKLTQIKNIRSLIKKIT